MIKRHYEVIVSIECDCCLNEEFIPELDDKDKNEMMLAWEQAENMGWRKLPEEDLDYHFCPTCVQKHFRVQEATPEQVVEFMMGKKL
jgi:Zn finger protein HypA/HybF involved in hydrogenase expression